MILCGQVQVQVHEVQAQVHEVLRSAVLRAKVLRAEVHHQVLVQVLIHL
jgi:hypothetical protein